MTEYAKILLAAIFCGAAVTVITEARGRLHCPVRSRENSRIFALFIVSGSGEGLEEQLRGLRWLRDAGRADFPVIIVPEDASGEAAILAERLARRYGAELSGYSDLHNTIKELTWTSGEETTQ